MLGLKFISSNFSVLKGSNVFRQLSTKAPKKSAYVNSDTTVVMARKSDIKQSPLKMKFLVNLVRGRWVPDALAQLKFSPKHRAVDVAKVVNVSFPVFCLIGVHLYFIFAESVCYIADSPRMHSRGAIHKGNNDYKRNGAKEKQNYGPW
jgi:ribosomal protein L22